MPIPRGINLDGVSPKSPPSNGHTIVCMLEHRTSNIVTSTTTNGEQMAQKSCTFCDKNLNTLRTFRRNTE